MVGFNTGRGRFVTDDKGEDYASSDLKRDIETLVDENGNKITVKDEKELYVIGVDFAKED